MTDSRKKRMTMLDSLAAAGAPAPVATPMMASNRALRSARDAVDSHTVWELDPKSIEDTRPEDRLDPADVQDLMRAIETNGQTVPILVRRDPNNADRYLLVYGRRRLESIRQSSKVDKVKALVATMDDDGAVRAQISENMARRDLSFIEKALFASSLIESGFGKQKHVAEVLTITKSAISMSLAVVEQVGADLIRAIGPAHGIGRPRWEALGKGIEDAKLSTDYLIEIAEKNYAFGEWSEVLDDAPVDDPSVAAFEAVFAEVERAQPRTTPKLAPPKAPPAMPLRIEGARAGSVRRTATGLKIELQNSAFADWLELEAETVIQDLHARWKDAAEE